MIDCVGIGRDPLPWSAPLAALFETAESNEAA
jgi:hypothetical protein